MRRAQSQAQLTWWYRNKEHAKEHVGISLNKPLRPTYILYWKLPKHVSLTNFALDLKTSSRRTLMVLPESMDEIVIGR
jgi:hypothetical protein